MFYLKYRPQTIKEIDNQTVKDRLTKLVSSKNISHALLFTGPKGTGKTSSARIVAKAINCENNSFADKSNSYEPCNECKSCIAITKGSALDIIEMDGASNRKIDDIRNLISQLKFAPSSHRFKVYIIDEVHMLTKEAFNALLKSLEEPPPSTIFILATTEIDKLPKTIVSRCIQIAFAKAQSQDIVTMLQRIAQSEKLDIDNDVLEYISNHSDNSFRDAAKLLQEAIIHDDISVDAIKKLLGLDWNGNELLKLISDKNIKAALTYTENFAEKGGSFTTLLENLLNILHLQLLKKNEIDVEVDTEYNLTIKEIARLIGLFQKAHNQIRFSPIEELPLEIAIVEFFEKGR